MHRLALALAIWGLLTLPAQAKPVLEEIGESGALKVAVREDAPPFGYLDSNQELRGYCLDFVALLREQLKAKLNKEAIAIHLLKSTVSNRFELVGKKLVFIECGANTIRQLAEDSVTFSRPFFQTETQFLVSTKSKLDLAGDLAGISIGVIQNSSNQSAIADKYPLAKIVTFSGITARERGVQALQQGKIEVMVSDGVLLWAEIARQNLPVKDYQLVAPEFAEKDYYGMILPAPDPQWQEFVNAVITSSQSQTLFQQWFGAIEDFPLKVNLEQIVDLEIEK